MVGIIQSKLSKIKAVDLCHSMDLVAIATIDGILNIYRTFSW